MGSMAYTIVRDAQSHLKYEDEMSDRLYGMSDPSRALIAIRPGLAPGWEKQTLIHEILHQVFRQSGMGGMTADDEESIIRHLESGVLGVIRDNPDLVAYLTAGD